ncbi:hypothetical protein [Cupriavidus basilensis]|uniref:hypothetical protein n=1 Tax=Cupriavidus basilensis TaxID=68895 RepID=UPI00030A3B74|nr:hypothetical protein [Cupriavidus basilensis]
MTISSIGPTRRIALGVLAACVSLAALAAQASASPDLSVAQIVEKNAAARGGLEAWRKIQTMVWVGHVESANAPARFLLAMKRPNKTRFEITALNQMAVRVFDGSHGWKLHPTQGGKPNLQPYSLEEVKFAHDEQVIDGPLMDYEAKGIAVTLDGVDEVEGHKAYRLGIRLPSGGSRHLWIDAKTFLELKYDRESRNVLGQLHTVTVFYRDYRAIDGLQIPCMIESGVATAQATDKLVIDEVSFNPSLGDWMFAKPGTPRQDKAVSIDAQARSRLGDMVRPAP